MAARRESWPGKCPLVYSEKSTGSCLLSFGPITSLSLGLLNIVTREGYNSFRDAFMNLTHLELKLLNLCWSPSASPIVPPGLQILEVEFYDFSTSDANDINIVNSIHAVSSTPSSLSG